MVVFRGTECPVCKIEAHKGRIVRDATLALMGRDKAIDVACRYHERACRAEAEVMALKDARWQQEHPGQPEPGVAAVPVA